MVSLSDLGVPVDQLKLVHSHGGVIAYELVVNTSPYIVMHYSNLALNNYPPVLTLALKRAEVLKSSFNKPVRFASVATLESFKVEGNVFSVLGQYLGRLDQEIGTGIVHPSLAMLNFLNNTLVKAFADSARKVFLRKARTEWVNHWSEVPKIYGD
jgi:hypothetical protein